MEQIAQNPFRAKPLDCFGDLLVNRVPAVSISPAGPRTPGGRWIARRYGVPAASADLFAELTGLGVTEASHG
jgi:hypothetical protein